MKFIKTSIILIPMAPELSSQKLIYSNAELKDMGFSYYKIAAFVEQGILIKLNKSHYENTSFNGYLNDFYYVSAFVKEGIVCLMSAAVYYGLTTFRPDSIDVAVPAKKKLSTYPENISLSLHYFSATKLSTGVQMITEGENCFKIFDIEKTVADIISDRNKIGIEETKEVLSNYLSRSSRNINQLYRYASQIGCLKTLKTYLEVLV